MAFKWGESPYCFLNAFALPGIDPASVFGLKSSKIKEILQEMAIHNKEYIRVSFVKDLDTVHLTQDVKSIDIISLFHEGE